MRHYLDHASTSPLRPAARLAMTDWLATTSAADAGRIHTEGHATRVALEEAREEVASFLGARSREVVFTSGATESIAMAVWGAAERADGAMVVPAIEHSAVRLSCEQFGTRCTVVPCDRTGRVAADAIVAAIAPDTALVHLQWGNHEVGTTQPVAEVVAACRERNVLVHVDAAQAVGHAAVDFDGLGADLMSVSAHKMGGPPGLGALLIRRGLRLRSLLRGSDQERARRAGLENAPAIVGWGAACRELAATATGEVAWQHGATERLRIELGRLDGITVFGNATERLPHIVCLGIEGIEPQAVLLGLDQRGIAAHSGSACASEDLLPSPVLEAMGVDAQRSLRLSVGWSSTDADIDAVIAAVPDVISYLRRLSQ